MNRTEAARIVIILCLCADVVRGVDDLERALRQLLLSRDVAWDGGGHDWDDAVRDAQRLIGVVAGRRAIK